MRYLITEFVAPKLHTAYLVVDRERGDYAEIGSTYSPGFVTELPEHVKVNADWRRQRITVPMSVYKNLEWRSIQESLFETQEA